MKTTRTLILGSIVACVLLSLSVQAGTVTGKLWKLPDPDTYLADPSTVPATSPDVDFLSPTPFTYSLQGSVGDWLATGGALGITENTPGTLVSAMSDGVIGSVVEFTGCITVSTGDAFTFTHDDGMYLSINGIDLGFFANPTSPFTETQTYTGPSGTYPFQLVYTENHSGPAVLEGGSGAFTTCPAAPDGGSSLALMSMGLAGLLLGFRRPRK